MRYLVLLFLLLLAGCQQPTTAPPVVATASPEPAHHEHTAPHDGTLIVFGEEFAHLELVLDGQAGKLTAYVLDGEAENPVRLEAPQLEIRQGEEVLQLLPVANELTGETAESTSQYEVTADSLKGATTWKGSVVAITLKGQSFEEVEFDFPEGNEHHEGEHGDHGEEHEGEHADHEDEHGH